ncbi:hypothetical protein DYU11_21140 [Fibrisoma montanum]|uniref:Uncharacterized protein n=1 Tax=Fibrisoma montanum TaxID=2305895 RepID=A0A418M4G6_9BACT|nr:hypothetical protein [Fibrisoma montanum]RIV20553.1 hypothetical protein DYU11_21140 [Fibrisoma montanum]
MLQTAQIADKNGTITREVPAATYQISREQYLAAVGVDYPPDPKGLDGGGQVEWWLMGRFEDLGFIMQCQLRNSLMIDNWDFATYPNPYVLCGDILHSSPNSTNE